MIYIMGGGEQRYIGMYNMIARTIYSIVSISQG